MTVAEQVPGQTVMLRIATAQSITGDSRTSFYDKIAKGLLPRAVKISARAAAWPSHEIDAVNRARISGKSEDDIRKLVSNLQAARTAVA
jgi:prophage regulatory protein